MSVLSMTSDREWLARRLGSIEQVARIECLSQLEGNARGARVHRVTTGGGLVVDVHPDRCLDLGHVSVRGIPVPWISPVGIAAPWFYEGAGNAWLRTFGGGLLTTCGLDTVGAADEDNGESLGMHGRIGAQPGIVTRAEMSADEIVISGTVRQAAALGQNLVLRRELRFPIGERRVLIRDEITNESAQASAHMVLYHVNIGWPLVSERSELGIVSDDVWPRDERSQADLKTWQVLTEPRPDYEERVFTHVVRGAGRAPTAVIRNEELGLALVMRSDPKLPFTHVWKLLGEGNYVVGLEPSNSGVLTGRSSARDRGMLSTLAPHETVVYDIELSFSDPLASRVKDDHGAGGSGQP
jgi:hypothetical protein